MLTIFTTPKPFRGHIHDIQWNALKSWTLLEPRPQILLLGNEFGAEDAARELGLIHLPEIRRNTRGTPLLSDLLLQAQQHARFPTLMLANADMIFLPGLMQTVSSIFTASSRCLITGRRTNLEVKGRRDFSPGWAKQLEDSVRQSGKDAGPTALDYFIFPRDFLGAVPDFAYGRVYWDNWILFRARSLGADLVDASNGILAVHQNHDYSHAVSDGSSQSVWSGEEAFANRRLVLSGFLMTLDDANWRLKNNLLVSQRIWNWRRHCHELALAGLSRKVPTCLQSKLNWCARFWWDRSWKKRYSPILKT